ncbi:MAG: hypothetical protein FWC71_01450 [Defluviitaleaceae bacterium]|nr:hypothetical protein [Defluviitaleaceae bacterium]
MKKYFKYLLAMATLLFVLTGLLTGCGGGEIYEDLVGRWQSTQSMAMMFTFNEDGTGSRRGETFTWSVSGDTLRINRDRQYVESGEIRNERWTFTIGDNQTLRLSSQQERGFILNFNQVGIVDPALASTWEWNDDPTWRYVFGEAGGGNRGFEGDVNHFIWGMVNGQLRIFALGATNVTDSWNVTITGNTLRLQNTRNASEVFYYTRRD